jgi:hypothetical protein
MGYIIKMLPNITLLIIINISNKNIASLINYNIIT